MSWRHFKYFLFCSQFDTNFSICLFIEYETYIIPNAILAKFRYFYAHSSSDVVNNLCCKIHEKYMHWNKYMDLLQPEAIEAIYCGYQEQAK